jgi:hypothetical protein
LSDDPRASHRPDQRRGAVCHGDGPLAERPELIRRYAEEIVQRHPDAEPEDVLLWAEAREYSAEEQQA